MARTIPIPAYLLGDHELHELARRLQPFADGDPDHGDDGPCETAQEAIRSIARELRGRDLLTEYLAALRGTLEDSTERALHDRIDAAERAIAAGKFDNPDAPAGDGA